MIDRFDVSAGRVRDAAGHEQDEHERVGEEAQELDDRSKRLGRGDLVGAERAQPFVRLGAGQALAVAPSCDSSSSSGCVPEAVRCRQSHDESVADRWGRQTSLPALSATISAEATPSCPSGHPMAAPVPC